ncbi:MAG: cytochrome c biogenesis protein CcdA [Desulfuromonadaceae bacterium]|nr:cytochrome c biogenesis protein CcdA [Desulfuromonadaceae bacterium]
METGADITVWIAFTAGVLSFFSPCVLPLIPSYITYITGLSFAEVNAEQQSQRIRLVIFLHSCVFVMGFSVIFMTLGGLAGFASARFQAYLHDGLTWIQRGGGLLIFLFGVHLSGLFHFGVLLGDKRLHLRNKPGGFLGTFVVGLAFAAGWTPCIGPILGSILAVVAGSSQGVGSGIGLLAVYSAGLGVPFIVSGVLFHLFITFFDRFRQHIRLVEIFTGGLLMVVGILLFFDFFKAVTNYLLRWLPVLG